ncbi:MAG: cell division protein FtsQ/DivIB [Shimia sp.]
MRPMTPHRTSQAGTVPPTMPPAAAPRPRVDPAPSRWAYRLERLWLTPVFRALLRTGLPCLILGGALYGYVQRPEVTEALAMGVVEARRSVEERPEFMVRLLSIEGAAPDVAEALRIEAGLTLPVSSFDLDLPRLRDRLAAHPAVRDATVRLRPGGTLQVDVIERVPALIWRQGGTLTLLDIDGAHLRTVATRATRADLPLVAGAGADRAVPEAMDVIAAAAPVAERLRGLVRVGERRWDVVLTGGQRLLLPEADPVPALERAIVLDGAQDLLARDISAIDLRNPETPTLRLRPGAQAELRRIRGLPPLQDRDDVTSTDG